MIKIISLFALRTWVSPEIRLGDGKPDFFYNRNLKSQGSSFKSKTFWINSMSEYKGRT